MYTNIILYTLRNIRYKRVDVQLKIKICYAAKLLGCDELTPCRRRPLRRRVETHDELPNSPPEISACSMRIQCHRV